MKKKVYTFLTLILIFVILFFLSQKIKVVAAKCESQFGPCSDEVSTIVNGEVGNSFFTAKRDLGKALSDSSRVENYIIRFNLPDTLLVEVVEKKAEAALKFAEDRYFLFDSEGNVVAETTETALPTLEVIDVPSDPSVQFAIKLFLDLFKYYDVTSGKIDKFSLTTNIRGADVIFPITGDVDLIFGSLEVSLLQLNRVRENSTISEAGILTTIDLRYKNPVIR